MGMIESAEELKEAQDLCLQVADEIGKSYDYVSEKAVKLYQGNMQMRQPLPYFINKVRDIHLAKDNE